MVASFVVASLLQWRTDTFLLSEGETERPVEINRAKIPLLSCPERLQSRLDSIETGVKPRSLKFSRIEFRGSVNLHLSSAVQELNYSLN